MKINIEKLRPVIKGNKFVKKHFNGPRDSLDYRTPLHTRRTLFCPWEGYTSYQTRIKESRPDAAVAFLANPA